MRETSRRARDVPRRRRLLTWRWEHKLNRELQEEGEDCNARQLKTDKWGFKKPKIQKFSLVFFSFRELF